MINGRTSFKFFMINLLAHTAKCFGSTEAWSNTMFKARLGISKQTFKNWMQAYKAEVGNKELLKRSVSTISKATGIRVNHLIERVVHPYQYPFDVEVSRSEFADYVQNQFGLLSQFGLDNHHIRE